MFFFCKSLILILQDVMMNYVITDHIDNHWLWRQDPKDVDGTDVVRWVCPPGNLLLCLARCK